MAMDKKSKFKKIATAKPGKRFFLLHRYSRRKLSNPIVLLVFLAISSIAFILGLIMLFTPGPGLLFLVVALLPFIAISKNFACFLDKVESFISRKSKKLRKKNRKE